MAETVVIRFKGEDDVTSVADKVSGSVDKVGDSAKNAGKGFSALGEIAVGALRGIGEIALDVGKNALAGAFDFFKTAVEGSAEYDAALAQTRAVIKSTGMAAGITSAEMEKMARDLSAVSGQSLFTDDQLLSAQNVLATFTNIRKAEFGAATKAIANLSQAMGQDLKSSAVQVGKALNDPVQGITALQRVGVSFTEEQKSVVESLMETGDAAAAQQLILAELERQFGGSAAMAAQTFSGRMVVMSERIEDAKGAIGDAMLPLLMELTDVFNDDMLPVIKIVTANIAAFFEGIRKNGGVMATIDNLKKSFGNLVATNPILQRIIELGRELWKTFDTLLSGIKVLAADPNLQKWGGFALQILEKVALIIIDVVILAFRALGTAINVAVQVIKIFANAMEPVWSVVYPKIVAALTAISQLLRGDFAGAWTTVKNIVVGAWTELLNKIGSILSDITKRLSNFINDIVGTAIDIGKDIVSGIAQGIMQAKASVEKALKSVIDDAIKKIKDMLGISSPSKALAMAIGAPMAQGIAAGITAGIPDIQRALGIAVSAPPASSQMTTQNFYLTANYATMQSQSSLRNDLRAMQLLAGGVA